MEILFSLDYIDNILKQNNIFNFYRTLFNAVPLLHFVVLVVPQGTQIGEKITFVL